MDDWVADVPGAAKPSPGSKETSTLARMTSSVASATGRRFAKVTKPLARATVSPVWWAAIACTLLLCSAGVRHWRDLQFAGLNRESETCPFPLNDLPRNLGNWNSSPEDDGKLDPEIADLAGSSDHIIRVYRDDFER